MRPRCCLSALANYVVRAVLCSLLLRGNGVVDDVLHHKTVTEHEAFVLSSMMVDPTQDLPCMHKGPP